MSSGDTHKLIFVFKVREVTDKVTRIKYAAKILRKKQIVKENKVKYVATEKTVMEKLRHPNIVRLFYTFQTTEELCIFYITSLSFMFFPFSYPYLTLPTSLVHPIYFYFLYYYISLLSNCSLILLFF